MKCTQLETWLKRNNALCSIGIKPDELTIIEAKIVAYLLHFKPTCSSPKHDTSPNHLIETFHVNNKALETGKVRLWCRKCHSMYLIEVSTVEAFFNCHNNEAPCSCYCSAVPACVCPINPCNAVCKK